MTPKKGVRVFVAGMFFACALVATTSMTAQADTVVTTITFPSVSSPEGVAINPAGTFAYVLLYSFNVVKKIDVATDTVVATIAAGNSPYRAVSYTHLTLPTKRIV